MKYQRMPIEIESPEELGYEKLKFNLTESSFTDFQFKDLGLDLNDLTLCYGDHAGHPKLRSLIAEDASLEADNVLLTVGAAGALFIVATSMLNATDNLVVVRPNYATNIETPRAIGADIRFLDLKFENGFQIDIDEVRSKIDQHTRYISVTHPHNPTGICIDDSILRQLVSLAEETNCLLLVDETYRDMNFDGVTPVAASLSDRVISVSSLSKTYGLPGIRLGWIACRNKALMETFLAAKEQIYICNSVLDEEIGYQFMNRKAEFFPAIKAEIKAKRKILGDWFAAQADLEWVEPQAGVACFPRIARPEHYDVEKFYRVLNETYGTYVGPGHWFEMPRYFFRIGFGWPPQEELSQGLNNISHALRDARV